MRAITEDEVRERLRAAIRDAGTQKAWAEQAGVSAAYVNDVLKGARRPGEAILRALGLARLYGEAGENSRSGA